MTKCIARVAMTWQVVYALKYFGQLGLSKIQLGDIWNKMWVDINVGL